MRWDGWSENDLLVLRSEHRLIKIDKLMFLCLDLTCFMPKTLCVPHFSTSGSGVFGATKSWMFCLNVMVFVSKQISVQNGSNGNTFPHGARGLD